MRKKFKVSYYLRSNFQDKNGKSPIMACIYIGDKMITANTHVHVPGELWNPKTGHMKGKTPEAMASNLALDHFKSGLHSLFERLSLDNEEITAEFFKDVLNGKAIGQTTSFLQSIDQYILDFNAQVGHVRKKSTLGKYETTKTRLKDCMLSKYGRGDMPLHELDYGFVNGFDIYLKTTREYRPNTVARYMRRFKTFVIFARNSGYLQHDPFAKFKIRMEREDRGYLTDEELNRLMAKKLHVERLEKVRAIFVFSCFTGLSYIDVKQLGTDNIIVENGMIWVNTTREKTAVRSNIPLLDVPLRIIDKYEPMRTGDKIFPVPSNQKVNNYLKEIADICDINKNLTFHLARHTFSTTITSENISLNSKILRRPNTPIGNTLETSEAL